MAAELPESKIEIHPVVRAAAEALAAVPSLRFYMWKETPAEADIVFGDSAQVAAVAAPAVLRHVADGLCCGGELYRIADEIERGVL